MDKQAFFRGLAAAAGGLRRGVGQVNKAQPRINAAASGFGNAVAGMATNMAGPAARALKTITNPGQQRSLTRIGTQPMQMPKSTSMPFRQVGNLNQASPLR